MAIRSSESVRTHLTTFIIIIMKYGGKATTVLKETSGYEGLWRSGRTSLVIYLAAGRN